MSKGIRTQKMAELLGVTPQTVRKYAEQGSIPHHSTPTGQLLFTPEDVKKILGEDDPTTERKWAHYARSSNGNQEEINNQYDKLEKYYGEPDYKVSDKASGLNENRKGLKRLIELARNREITDIAITREDRLARFGYRYLGELFGQNGVTIHCMSEKRDASIEEELMADFMAIIASFSGKYSQLKSQSAKRALLNKALDDLDEE